MTPPASKPCKDCKAEWDAYEAAGGASTGTVAPKNSGKRPAPYPGPRCKTHHNRRKREASARAHANYVKRTYSLDDQEYNKLYVGQGGTCAICKRATGATRKLSVDHDHKCCSGGVSCGFCVRGLLCRPCNDILGHARDDWEFFARAIRYVIRPPAYEILGKKVIHVEGVSRTQAPSDRSD